MYMGKENNVRPPLIFKNTDDIMIIKLMVAISVSYLICYYITDVLSFQKRSMGTCPNWKKTALSLLRVELLHVMLPRSMVSRVKIDTL